MPRIQLINQMILILCCASMTACAGGGLRLPWQPQTTLTSTPSSTSTPTAPPSRELNICLGSEPDSLYIYAKRQSASMWSVLEAIYDGPFDLNSEGINSVILQKTPSFEDGDLVIAAVPVTAGDHVIDADNDLVVLEKDTRILPAGCGDSSCAITWDGSSDLMMDQVTAIFKLRSNILWSDGIPLTVDDSLFSFEVASNRSTTTLINDIDRTMSYQVEDDTTIKWVGVPGFQNASIPGMFWSPLPEHILGDIPVSEIHESELATRQPLGWGPYVLKEWVAGESIELTKNKNYFRANEGLPKFDRVFYRFIDPTSGGSLAALAAGQCDVVERSSDPQSDISLIVNLVNTNKAIANWKAGPEIQQLAVGLNPAAYDDGYNAAIDRLDYFRNPAIRQTLAVCIDRERINNKLFTGKAGLASLNDLLGSQSKGLPDKTLGFDPVSGNQILEQNGWRDLDNDPATARTAVNVPGVPEGTPLSLTLLSPADSVSISVASSISSSLGECGIEIKTETLPFDILYAPGPEGKIFGRAFDLVLLSWQHSLVPACYLYRSNQIPSARNYWVGGNIAGYNETDFDVACSRLLNLQSDNGDYELALQQAADIFVQDLPGIPLFLLPKIVLTRPDFCKFSFEPSAKSDLTNMELFDYGSQCVP